MTTYFILTMIFGGEHGFSVVTEYNTMEKCQSAYMLMKTTAKKEDSWLHLFGTCTPK